MDQCIFETMSAYYAFLLRVRLTEPEQKRLLNLFLRPFAEKDAACIRDAAQEIGDWDYRTLNDELFKSKQYSFTDGIRQAVIRAKSASIASNDGSEAIPPIESRASLLCPETQGAKYDKALLDYARGEKKEAENGFSELFIKNYSISAGEMLACMYSLDGAREKLGADAARLADILRAKMLMDPPEWLVRIVSEAGISDCLNAAQRNENRSWLNAFVPFNPTSPCAEKERIGFI